MINELFIEISNIFVLVRTASSSVLADMTVTTASDSTAWSTSATWAGAFDAAAITLFRSRIFLLGDKCRTAWNVAEEVIVTHI